MDWRGTAVLMVFVLGTKQGFLSRLLSFQPLRYMGRISYTFYLYQVAVMDELAHNMHSHAEIAVVAFSSLCFVSAFSWHFFESQMLKLKNPATGSHSEYWHSLGNPGFRTLRTFRFCQTKLVPSVELRKFPEYPASDCPRAI